MVGYSSRPIRVLHAVQNWLPTTENWCYRTIASVPDVETHILARVFAQGSIWNDRFKAHNWPFRDISNPAARLSPRIWNRLQREMMPLQIEMLARSLRGHVDLLHAHFAPVGWEHISLARKLRVPLVTSFYGYDYEKIPHDDPRWNGRYRQLYKAAAAIFCEGEKGIRHLIAQGCPSGKLNVARLGVDIDSIEFRGDRSIGVPLRVLQLARLTEKKGHRDAIHAVAKAAREVAINFTIVGADADVTQEDLRKLAVELGVGECVHFEERVDFQRLHEYLAGFDLFLHPSRTAKDGDCEGGAPVVLIDAQAIGLPVVSTFHCDIPDEVIDGSTGFLANEGDVDALAAAIIRFARMDRGAIFEMRRAGRRHVEEKFDSARNGKIVGALYRRIFNEQ